MTDPATLYETDPHAWTLGQADAMRDLARTGRIPGSLDVLRLIEELDSMARSDRRRVEGLAIRIIQHLLMLEASRAAGPRRHWEAEIAEFRAQLAVDLTATLEQALAARLDRAFEQARRPAAAKLKAFGEDAAVKRLPERRAYTLEQVKGDWLPPDPPAT